MNTLQFIFSEDRKVRLRRHFLFWFCWWVSQSFLYAFASGLSIARYGERLPVSAFEALLFLTPHMFLAYSMMYGVVPKFLLRGKYLLTILAVIGCFVLTGAISALMGMFIIYPIRVALFGGRIPAHANELHFFLGLLAGLRGAITIGGLAAAIKLMKYWYAKEQLNLQLQKENAEAQLQLLKAQVQPHFLFNTLNNVYAHAQKGAPVAAQMIMGLSDLLRFMLYEGNQRLVPLHKELKMLEDYLLLEKIRYGNKLELSIDLPDDTGTLEIAPLLLLPYVENCFKHGANHILDQPWISLQVSLEDDCMHFNLVNAKPPDTRPSSPGIGMKNVAARLELQYEGRHELTVTDEADIFAINLKLRLDRATTAGSWPDRRLKPAAYE